MAINLLTKNDQRKIAYANRKKLSSSDKQSFGFAISEKLLSLEDIKKAKNILSYMATEDEVSLDHFAEIAKDKKISYPVSYAQGIMKAYLPNSGDSFVTGKFGIISPKEDDSVLVNPEDIDVVIVPCVGFSENMKRLGHGAGYYDRYLDKCTKAKYICVAFEAQKLDNVITDQYDKLMDIIVTEEKIYLPE